MVKIDAYHILALFMNIDPIVLLVVHLVYAFISLILAYDFFHDGIQFDDLLERHRALILCFQ